MSLNRAVGVESLAVVSLVLLLLPAWSASAQRGVDVNASDRNAVADVLPRRALPKTPSVELTIPVRATGEILVKFNDNVRARMQAGVLNAQGAINVAPARAIMAQFQLTAAPLFSWTSERLGRLEAKAAAASGKAQPDLAGMIAFRAPWANLQAAARALNDLDSVEWVSFREDWQPMAGGLRRCCFPDDGHCELFTLADCIALQGSPGAAGSDCTFECGPGACCVNDNCRVTFDEEDCVALGGIYQGWDPGVDCENVLCGDGPFGACCRPNGTCQIQSESVCNAIQGVWRGDNTNCGDFNGNGIPDTCESIGSCRSDSNDDGIVGIIDFLTLLADWGPCR